MSVSARNEFAGKHVLLTGVTGYLGQLLLAKLLAVCPDIGHAYVVVRANKTGSGLQRFQALCRSSLAFEIVQNSCQANGISDYLGWIASKVTVLEGDISKENFAFTAESLNTVVQSLDVFIHSAADVSFTNTFHDAVRSNLMGTVNAMDLAKTCSKRPIFCYVSTAYVSAHLRFETYVHEAEPVAIPFRASNIVQAFRDDDVAMITRCEQKMVDMQWPNTYVMSKACAENYVLDEHDDLPLEIIRPSMIASAWKDLSEVGWNQSPQSGATLCTYAIGLGALTIAPIHPKVENHLDLVPSDYCANVVITALACRINDEKNDIKTGSQIHYAVLGEHRVSANLFFPRTVAYFRRHPMPARMRKPRVSLYHGKTFENNVALRYTAPIKAIKAMSPVLVGPLKKPSEMLVGALEMMSKLFRVSRWVVEAEFAFNDRAVGQLFDRLAPDERTVLWNDLQTLDHETYIDDFCSGVVKLMAEETRKSKMEIRSNM